MKKYDFDKIIKRGNTANVKYDLRESYFGRGDVLPMWVADMDFETPDFIREAVIQRASHPIYGYSFRNDEYYDSIGNWLDKRFGVKVERDWLIFNPGVVPALNFSVLSFTKPGDSVIVQPPVYFPFFNAIKNNDRKIIENPLVIDEGKYKMDFDDLRKKAADAKMMFLCSPHNPVGRCWSEEEIKTLAEICVENSVILVSDEIHGDLVLPGFRHTPTALVSDEIADNLVTCIAPSKTFNMAGLATSTIIISNESLRKKYQETLEKVHITNGNLFGIVASIAGYNLGERWLTELLEYVNQNFELLQHRLENEFESIRMMPAEATYLAWLDFRALGMEDEEIKKLLIEKAGLGFTHGPIFGTGGNGFQRMNLAAPKSVVNDAIDKLRSVFH